MNLSQPSEVSDGSDDDDDDEVIVASSNGNEGGVSNGVAVTSGGDEIEAEEHPVEMEPGEEPPSPTSSGYDGERGSSGGATSTYKADDASEDEIREANVVDGETASQQKAAWLPGKRHVDEVSFI